MRINFARTKSDSIAKREGTYAPRPKRALPPKPTPPGGESESLKRSRDDAAGLSSHHFARLPLLPLSFVSSRLAWLGADVVARILTPSRYGNADGEPEASRMRMDPTGPVRHAPTLVIPQFVPPLSIRSNCFRMLTRRFVLHSHQCHQQGTTVGRPRDTAHRQSPTLRCHRRPRRQPRSRTRFCSLPSCQRM
jgi:hypothetical protein